MVKFLSGSWFAGVLASVLAVGGFALASVALLVVAFLCGLMALCLREEEKAHEPKA